LKAEGRDEAETRAAANHPLGRLFGLPQRLHPCGLLVGAVGFEADDPFFGLYGVEPK
jgi:hypothetical protein